MQLRYAAASCGNSSESANFFGVFIVSKGYINNYSELITEWVRSLLIMPGQLLNNCVFRLLVTALYIMVIQTMFHCFKHNFMITIDIIPVECVPADATAVDAILDSCKTQ